MKMLTRKSEKPFEEPVLRRRDWELIAVLLREARDAGRFAESDLADLLALVEPRLELTEFESMAERRARLMRDEKDVVPTGWPTSFWDATHPDQRHTDTVIRY